MSKIHINKKILLCLALLLAVTVAVIAAASSAEKKRAPAWSGGYAVHISEVMTANTACPDEDGRICDWVEIENTGSGDFDLSGYYLSDEIGKGKYRFPAGTVVPAHSFFVVNCSTTEDGCAPFALKQEGGESVCLMTDNQLVLDEAVTVASEKNQSLVRSSDGTLTPADRPSPGFPNTEAGMQAWAELLAERSGGVLRLSEIMTSNSLYPAEDGSFSDWIEVYNPSDKPVILTDYKLSDREDEARYTFPEGSSLGAGEYRVVQCVSGGSGEYTAPFALARAGGEKIVLTAPNNTVSDSVTLPALQKNTSYAVTENGEWSVLQHPTPGYSNDEAGYTAYISAGGYGDAGIVISEVSPKNRTDVQDFDGDFSDWIELYNGGANDISLKDWYLSDDAEELNKWAIPDVTVKSGEYLLIFASGKNRTDGELHTGFSLSLGETVTLSTPNAAPFCSVELKDVDEGYSLALRNGEYEVCHWPTPGYPNDAAGYEAIHRQDERSSPLLINEVVTYVRTDLGWDDVDWVELINTSTTAIDLSGWYLSEREDEPTMFPLSGTVEPGGVSVFTSDDLGLNAASEMLYLFDSRAEKMDWVFLHDIPYNGSCGRVDGENGFFYFTEPTRGKQNGNGWRRMADQPTTDCAPGVYDGVDELTVALSGCGTIRYTTDGSTPTEESELYTAPIPITETCVIRAAGFENGLLPSKPVTLSYFLNENSTIPIVSLVADHDDLYGGKGIYDMHETAWEQDWERECTVSFFEDGGEFTMDCGMQIHGRTSRRVSGKRSFKLKFRDVYDGELHYDIFGDGVVTDFTSILLRASIEDTYTSHLRDILFAELARQGTDVFFQNYRFVNMYVNGEYWGLYAIREHHSEDYFAAHTGVDASTVDIKGGEFKVPGPWLDILTYCENHWYHLPEPEDYEYINERVNIEEMIDWLVLECYSGNIDVFTNVRFYASPDYDGGRYYYGLTDLDLSLMDHKTMDVGFDIFGQLHSIIPQALRRNPLFRDAFLKRMAEMLQTTLSRENVWKTVDELAASIEPETARDMIKWGRTPSLFDTQISHIKEYTEYRAEELIRGAISYFAVTDEEAHQYFADFGY